jgi:lipoprotein-releasing system permease protein
MQLPYFIARRYFISKKSQRAINIISMISVAGVLVGTAALIIVLSVFNGFEDLIVRLYNSFDTDIRIEAKSGKTFAENALPWKAFAADPIIAKAIPVIEENALVKYNEKQFIITLKGVPPAYKEITGLDTMIVDGQLELERGDTDYAVVGAGVAYSLQLNAGLNSQIELYAPRSNTTSFLQPEEAFNRRYLSVPGVFSVQQEYDSRYVIVPFRFAREILEYDSLISHAELQLKPGVAAGDAVQHIRQLTGDRFVVKNRFQQHESIYRIMKSEKWAVFLILTFILIIATFNIIGTLSMLVIEKKKDIAVLYSMGADRTLLQRIFLAEGLFINLIGCLSGMAIGVLVCLGQQHFGWIQLSGSGSFVIDAYPVNMQAMDFLYVFLTVFSIGFIAAWYPARRLVTRSLDMGVVRNDE